ncbi:MAG: AAA family ATPase [Sedimentisphaerales bacterium]|nr:AAA family ATPase [Sedimentisphaerales bacterium]
MTTTIAISGKGGSGKTTLAAMIIRRLIEQGDSGAVLAVDADPNSCLGLTLGVEPVGIVADVRESARSKKPSNVGMDRVRMVEYGIHQAITESKGFDLLTMGRPEGPDCYCAVNNMLRMFLDNLSSKYRYVVTDNEAGMEHLSRRTTNNVDLLCIVAEPNPIGSITAKRISDLARQLPISVKRIGVIWNKVPKQFDPDAQDYLVDNVETFGHVPSDMDVFNNTVQGKTVFEIAKDNPAYSVMDNILESALTLCSSS